LSYTVNVIFNKHEHKSAFIF